MTRRYFYPRSPCGERPVPQQENGHAATISIHALLAESDLQSTHSCDLSIPFLSTLSLRRATPRLSRVVPTPIFLSTLSLRRATTSRLHKILADWDFYPRSPCGERLRRPEECGETAEVISIHALLAESDLKLNAREANEMLFLSTLSLRRATKVLWQSFPTYRYFYPRSPCGERLMREFAGL